MALTVVPSARVCAFCLPHAAAYNFFTHGWGWKLQFHPHSCLCLFFLLPGWLFVAGGLLLVVQRKWMFQRMSPRAAGTVSVGRAALTLRGLCGIWNTTRTHTGCSRTSRARTHSWGSPVLLGLFLVWSCWQVTRHHVQEKDRVHCYNASKTNVSRRLSFTTQFSCVLIPMELFCCTPSSCMYLKRQML